MYIVIEELMNRLTASENFVFEIFALRGTAWTACIDMQVIKLRTGLWYNSWSVIYFIDWDKQDGDGKDERWVCGVNEMGHTLSRLTDASADYSRKMSWGVVYFHRSRLIYRYSNTAPRLSGQLTL